jgi:hypothetical protein
MITAPRRRTALLLLAAAASGLLAVASGILSPNDSAQPARIATEQLDRDQDPYQAPSQKPRQLVRTAASAEFPNIPNDFDPDHLKDDEDPGVWLVYRELVTEYDDSDIPCRNSIPLAELIRSLRLPGAPPTLSPTERAELITLIEPFNKEIAELKIPWGYEYRMAQLRQIEDGRQFVYREGANPPKEAQDAAERTPLVKLLPGPTSGTTRLLAINPTEHPALNAAHSRLMYLDGARRDYVRDYVARVRPR